MSRVLQTMEKSSLRVTQECGIGARTFNRSGKFCELSQSSLSHDATALSHGTVDLGWREICGPDQGIYHRLLESTGGENSSLSSFCVARMINLALEWERNCHKFRQNWVCCSLTPQSSPSRATNLMGMFCIYVPLLGRPQDFIEATGTPGVIRRNNSTEDAGIVYSLIFHQSTPACLVYQIRP